MSGTSSATQNTNTTGNTTSSSVTNPWANATGTLNSILGQVNTGLNNTGLTSAQTNALNTIESNANNNPYTTAISNNATNLLNGGGATNQNGAISQNYQDYVNRLSSTANGNNIGANSALNPYLQNIQSDVANSVNGQFAAAGRDMSGANQQAYGRGVAQGIAPVLASQYNTDVNNQMNAANSLYGAGNTTSGLLNGTNQQYLSNQQQGTSAANDALTSKNYGANQTLTAEGLKQSIPTNNLSLLANIGTSIGSLGSSSNGTGTTSGTSNTTGTKTASQLDQANSWANLLGKVGSWL